MTDLRQYRLNNLNEIDHFMAEMGTDAFLDFERRVYSVLEKLKVMRYFDIEEKIIPDQQELFIKLCYEQWKVETSRRQVRKRQRQ